MRWFAAVFRQRTLERELDRELRFHLETRVDALVAQGRAPDAARREAMIEFGGLEQAKEACRDVRRGQWLEMLWQDLRYAVRQLRKEPRFTFVVVFTLALGIGANTAIFSFFHGVLLRPLPFDAPERIVNVGEITPKGGRFAVAPANFVAWHEKNRVFEDMALIVTRGVTMVGAGEPRQIQMTRVSASFFPILGVAPALGRTFQPAEDTAGNYGVAVVSHEFWRDHLGGDAAALGRVFAIDGESYALIGVMPAGFRFVWSNALRTDVWVPYPFQRDPPTQRTVHRLNAIARLKPGITLAQAQADMDRVARELAAAYPESNKDWGVSVLPLREFLVRAVRAELWMLMGAVGLLLLIACSNIANLLLARATHRQREIAIRTALGAGRWRIMRQLLTESFVLAGVGSAVGFLLARWAGQAIVAFGPANIPRLEETTFDARVLVFAVCTGVLTALLFGLIPALHASRLDVIESLKDAGNTPHYARLRLCSAFVILEIALAVALLAGAGLLIRSVIRHQSGGYGYNAENVLTMRVNLPRTKYAEAAGTGGADAQTVGRPVVEGIRLWKVRPEHAAFMDRIIERISAMPQVESVGAVNFLPFGRVSWGFAIEIEGRAPMQPQPVAWFRPVTPGYLPAMGIPLLRGRAITGHDNQSAPPVAIISEAMARKHFGEENPLGQRIRLRDGALDQQRSFEIIGVAGNTRQNIENALRPENWGQLEEVIYYPYGQQATVYADYQVGFRMGLSFVLRARADPAMLAPAIRAVVREIDPEQPIEQLVALPQLVADADRGYRFNLSVLAGFAGLAAALAGIGVFGVMNYAVAQRTREIGVRMALGAAPRDVAALVLRRGLLLTAVGIVAGLGIAVGLTRFLASLLYAVTPIDLATFVAVSIGAAVIGLIGCCVPVRRALSVDPIAVIRYE